MTDTEQRYVLGIAYQAGRDPRIKRGADGARDYFTEVELEKAAWSFLGTEMTVGIEHIDGTEGHAIVKESYIYRGPDWVMSDVAGEEVVVKSGDWLMGALLDDTAWSLYKSGQISGWSPQGSGRRVVAKSATVDRARSELAKLDALRARLIDVIERNDS